MPPRSGMVATAYLLHRGIELNNAIIHVRKRRRELLKQLASHVLEDYYVLIGTYSISILVSERNTDKYMWKHMF